jgi:putative membrane protein
MSKPRVLLTIALLLAALSSIEPSLAHGSLQEKDNFWSAWHFTPAISLPILLTVFTYLRGWRKRLRQQKPLSAARVAAFFAGIACFLIALESPIEPLSEHFFFFHQLEHMLLRAFGPLLILLSMPAGPLLQGLPSWLRHRGLSPLIRHPWTQGLYAFLSHPVVASAAFVGAMVLWQIPSLHDAAVENGLLHDLMHLSLVVTAFFFWWLIADPRGPHAKLPYPLRLVALWAVTVPDALVGAFITLARFPLYQVYDGMGERWQIDRLLDQQLGGILMWNDAMMGVIGMAVVFLLWRRDHRNQGFASKLS